MPLLKSRFVIVCDDTEIPLDLSDEESFERHMETCSAEYHAVRAYPPEVLVPPPTDADLERYAAIGDADRDWEDLRFSDYYNDIGPDLTEIELEAEAERNRPILFTGDW